MAYSLFPTQTNVPHSSGYTDVIDLLPSLLLKQAITINTKDQTAATNQRTVLVKTKGIYETVTLLVSYKDFKLLI